MNLWIGIGRLTRDPEIASNESTSISKFTLAVDRNGEGADFINCVAFGKQADFSKDYLKKGTKIAVEGRIKTGSYVNREGKTVYTFDIIVNRMEFAEAKKTQTMDEHGFANADDGGLPFK